MDWLNPTPLMVIKPIDSFTNNPQKAAWMRRFFAKNFAPGGDCGVQVSSAFGSIMPFPSAHIYFLATITTLVVLVLAACSNHRPPPNNSEIDRAIADAVTSTIAINKAVSEIERRQANLPSSQPVGAATAKIPPVIFVPPLDINWTGPLKPLIESLGNHVGYRVEKRTKPPINPVQIAVSGEFTNLAEAINSINDAAFGHATIMADRSRKVITIEYRH